MKRYSEFYDLKAIVCGKQVDEKTVLPLPEFPSKKLLSMNSRVVEFRREMLETWLQAIIQQEQILPSVFKFLDLSMSRMSFVMNMINCVSPPADEAIVLDLAAQLTSEARQKLKALEHFDKAFFEHRRKISETSLQTVLAHLLPLCADLIVGAKSIYIISKLIAPQHNRGYELFLHCLVRENTELLSSMHLHKHICQEFPGDTSQFAFEILLVLHEHYERTCQSHSLYTVMNYDTRALEVFNSRKDGEYNVSDLPRLQSNSEWIQLNDDQFPSIDFKYKSEDGSSYMEGTMVVNSSIDNLLSALVSLESRRKWDMFFEGGRVLETISDTEFNVMINLNFELGKVCYILNCTTEHYSPTSVTFTLDTISLPGTILPPGYNLGPICKSVYTLEAISESKDMMKSTLSSYSVQSDNDMDDSEAAAYSDSEVLGIPRCVLTYTFKQTKNTLAFTTAALEGRLILLSWSRLKALVENQDLVGSKGSISHDTLQDMVERKQLKVKQPLNSRKY